MSVGFLVASGPTAVPIGPDVVESGRLCVPAPDCEISCKSYAAKAAGGSRSLPTAACGTRPRSSTLSPGGRERRVRPPAVIVGSFALLCSALMQTEGAPLRVMPYGLSLVPSEWIGAPAVAASPVLPVRVSGL